MYRGFSYRGDKMLSLLPKKGVESDVESHQDSDDEEELFFDVIDIVEPEALDLQGGVTTMSRSPQHPGNVSPVVSTCSESVPLRTSPRKRPRAKRQKAEAKVLQTGRAKAKKKKLSLLRSKWTTEPFRGAVTIPAETPLCVSAAPARKEPVDYFEMFFSTDVIDFILSHSNLYGLQKTGTPVNITQSLVKDFIAIELLMGVVKMPAYTDYWAINTRYSQVANIMPLKMYQYMRKYIHFCNNAEVDADDRYCKVRGLLEMLRKNFCAYPNLHHQSIDEMMIPYKGFKGGSRKPYLKSKPKKGYKVFVRCSIDGFVHDFLFYDGAGTFRGIKFSEYEELFTMSSKVVLALCKSIPNPALHAVYFDNFFTTLPLIKYLRHEYGILSLGTIRENRLGGLNLITEEQLKKKDRGSYNEMTDNRNNISVVQWLDNKPVTFASSFVGATPVKKIKRWSKEAKKIIEVDCPQVVVQYPHMGGVDIADMLVALYRTEYKSQKWYMPIFSQFLDISVNNAWLALRRDKGTSEEMPLKKFRLSIANSLISSSRSRPIGRHSRAEKSTSLSPSPSPSRRTTPSPLPVPSAKHDEKGHFPDFGKRGRCRYCRDGQTNVKCLKCDMRLCLTNGRNCFLLFHEK